jgi:hypothetical protein
VHGHSSHACYYRYWLSTVINLASKLASARSEPWHSSLGKTAVTLDDSDCQFWGGILPTFWILSCCWHSSSNYSFTIFALGRAQSVNKRQEVEYPGPYLGGRGGGRPPWPEEEIFSLYWLCWTAATSANYEHHQWKIFIVENLTGDKVSIKAL